MSIRENECQICGVITPDIRHLTIDCFYELGEVSPKFERIKSYSEDGGWKWVYNLQICKGCRSVFMFDYLGDFIKNGAKVRRGMGVDENGIIGLSAKEVGL